MGLAGFITQLDLDTAESPWGTNPRKSLRAPIIVKITLGFSPIHDLPMGLDADGAMTAPAYTIGSIVKNQFGTVYSDNDVRSRSDREGPDSASRNPNSDE